MWRVFMSCCCVFCGFACYKTTAHPALHEQYSSLISTLFTLHSKLTIVSLSLYYYNQVKARGAKVYVITDNAKLAANIDDDPIVIPNNGPLTALIAVLPLQVSDVCGYCFVYELSR